MSNIERKRGDTYANEWVIKSRSTGLPVNITGYSFLLTVDPSPGPGGSATNLFQIVGNIVDAAAGRVEFAPSALQADNIGSFFYDVQMIDGAARKRTFDSGTYLLKQDITK
jgi:hypothetical protein